MQKKRIQKEDWMAFWLPLFCMLLIFLIKRIYPFGQESFLRTDLYHQYAPFLREFQAKLQSFAPMSYSFNLGLGVNFTSLLASPLNFFVFFFPKGLVLEYISYLIVLKIALCGMTASIYFRRHFRKGGYFSAIFGIIYALSGYIAAYSWNVMWLDCLILFPLILLGLEELMERGRPLLYTVSLALSILCNYYISIMICLFLILYFVSLFFDEREKTVRELGRRVRDFALYSFLSGMMAAVLLLPAIFALRLTASVEKMHLRLRYALFLFELFSEYFELCLAWLSLSEQPSCKTKLYFYFPLAYRGSGVVFKSKIQYEEGSVCCSCSKLLLCDSLPKAYQ